MILASKSPRRKEILQKIGFQIEIKSENIEEVSDKTEITQKIMDIAYKKTHAVAKNNINEYVIGADTVVEKDGVIYGKPADEKDAKRILYELSGQRHRVITAFCLINISKNIIVKDYDIAEVEFKKLNDEIIDWYIETKEPLDKAGAYGIQDKGAILVEKIEGNFFTVMGFPISKFVDVLKKLNIDLKKINEL